VGKRSQKPLKRGKWVREFSDVKTLTRTIKEEKVKTAQTRSSRYPGKIKIKEGQIQSPTLDLRPRERGQKRRKKRSNGPDIPVFARL